MGLHAVSLVDTAQPLKQKEILTGFPVASCGTQKSGLVWYTTSDAFKMFRDEPIQQPIVPPVYITGLGVNAEPVSLSGRSRNFRMITITSPLNFPA